MKIEVTVDGLLNSFSIDKTKCDYVKITQLKYGSSAVFKFSNNFLKFVFEEDARTVEKAIFLDAALKALSVEDEFDEY